MSKNLVEIEGFDVLRNKIKQLETDKAKRRELIPILRKVAQATVKAARQAAPVSDRPHKGRSRVIQPGNLKKSIGTITGKKGTSRTNAVVYVGPRTRGQYDGYYGNWVHEGVNLYRGGFKRNRRGNSAANARGSKRQTEGNPFMIRAYNATKGKVTADAEQKVAAFIQKRIDRLSNK